MKKETIVLWATLCLSCTLLKAQDTLQLEFKKKANPTFNVTYGGFKLGKPSIFKGIPEAMDYEIYLFNFQAKQSSYTSFKKGYFTKEEYEEIVSDNISDTVHLYRSDKITNSLAVVSALYPGNKKVIIPDLNFNHDFSDDEAHTYTVPDFDSKYPTDSLPSLAVPYQYVRNGKLIQRVMLLKVSPTSGGRNLANPYDKALLITAHYAQERAAHVTIEGKEYEIVISSPPEPDADYTEARHMYILDPITAQRLQFDVFPAPGIFFPIGSKMVKLDNISFFGDTADLIIK